MRSSRHTISCRFLAPVVALNALLQPVVAAQGSTQKPQSVIVWSVAVPAAPLSPPVLAGGRVFVAHLPGIVSAYAAADGAALWTADLNPDGPVAADAEQVFVPAGEALHALRASDGAVLWRAPTGALWTRPVARGGWVVAGGGDRLHALRAADGSSVWSSVSAPFRVPPAISGDTLFVAHPDGRVRALDLKDGRTIWESRIGGTPAEPIVSGNRLYVGASDGIFYALDTEDGAIEWRFAVRARVTSGAAADGERVYFVALDNMVRALDRYTGTLRWQHGMPFRPFGAPKLAGGFVLVAGSAPDVRLLHPQDGAPVGSLSFTQPLTTAPGLPGDAESLRIAGITGSFEESWKLTMVAGQ